MGKRAHNSGFTLIEIVVVLVIICVLAAVGVPSLVGMIRKAQTNDCEVKRNELMRYADKYLIGKNGLPIDLSGEDSDAQVDEIMAKLVEEYYPDQVGLTEKVKDTGRTGYKGICPSGGTVCAIYDPATKSMTMECSKHGGVTAKANLNTIDTAYEKTDSIFTSAYDAGEKTIKDYFFYPDGRDKGNKRSLDSTGPNTGAVIVNSLNNAGIDMTNSSFRIYYNNANSAYSGVRTLEFYLTDGYLNSMSPGSKVNYIKVIYQINSDGSLGAELYRTIGWGTVTVNKTLTEPFNTLNVSGGKAGTFYSDDDGHVTEWGK